MALPSFPHPDQNAVDHFTARLAYETDVADVRASQVDASASFVLLDVRSAAAWELGHVAGAVHLPHGEIGVRAERLDPAGSYVTYCWGPACNGATRGALALATRGFAVKEMLGGYEYWVREGFPTETVAGVQTREPDALTTAVVCGC